MIYQNTIMDAEYIRKVQEWVQVDNKVRRIKESIKALEDKELFDKRDELERDITEHVMKTRMEQLTINISDGQIKFSKTNSKAPLTMKALRSLLESYKTQKGAACSLDVNDLMDYVQENIETKTKIAIKRTIIEDSS